MSRAGPRTNSVRSRVVQEIPDSQGIQDSQDIPDSQGIDEGQDVPDSQGIRDSPDIQESLNSDDYQVIPDSQCDYENEAAANQDSDTTDDNEAEPLNYVIHDNEDNEVSLDNEVSPDNEVSLDNEVNLDNEVSLDNEVREYNDVSQDNERTENQKSSSSGHVESEVVDMKDSEMIIKCINNCLLPKLAKNYDESEIHPEFKNRNYLLNAKIANVIEELEKYEFKRSLGDVKTKSYKANTIAIVSSLLNLYKELLGIGSWNSNNNKEYAKKLDDCFIRKCKIKLLEVLMKNDICDSQEVYDKCLDELCKKLTLEDFKKYPAQVEVYCDLVYNSKAIDVKVKPFKVLPVALILIDDYIESNKIKGLLCCQTLLTRLTNQDFDNGNYYDVIYLSIKNALNHEDIQITEISQSCALQLCQIFPFDVKDEKLDDMYSTALEQLSTESNLYRKAALFNYTKDIMGMLEIKCVGKTIFKTIICDAIENCLTDSVAEILLMPSLECLEEWIKYCWPVWKLPVDFKVLCALLKYYSKCNTGEGGLLTQKLIVTLVSLCTPEEQREFTAQLEAKDEEESTKMEGLKKDIGINTNLD